MSASQVPGKPRIMTTVMSALALLLSIVAFVVAALALYRSDTPAPAAVGQVSVTTTVTVPADGPAVTPAGSVPAVTGNPSDPGTTPPIDPVGAYTRAYQDERLRMQSGGCNGTWRVGIDLDLPQVAGGNIDASYISCNPGEINSGLQQAEVPGPDTTPDECLERIRTQPAPRSIPVSKGLTICFRTDGNKAQAEAITQKIVFMTVTSVSASAAEGGILNVTLTAWNVP